MLVTCEQMAAAEARLFATGVEAETLMNQAGESCFRAIQQFFPFPSHAEVFCGKGNNAGDALVIARWLKRSGWRVRLHFSHGRHSLSPLSKRKLAEWEAEPNPTHGPPVENHLILIDGLLGIGSKGALRGPIREAAQTLNQIREEKRATSFAIDLPTGLDADTGEAHEPTVIADYTLSICQAKTGFIADSALPYLGRLVEIPLDIPFTDADRVDTSARFLFPTNLNARWPVRPFDFHKGKAGRVLIIAGSRGMTGAAVLAALGASRSGAGLVTLCVPEEIYEIVASQCSPEIMVQPVRSISEALTFRHDVVAIGPGMGSTHHSDLADTLFHHPQPMVIDADALNAIAGEDLTKLPRQRLLTPHPGELARLCGTVENTTRPQLTRTLADQWGVTLLHKGARTVIASPDHPVELNTTGHPGMASGGMGDVLTGVCASLIGQGGGLHDAACLGSWLLGRAAELARDEAQIDPVSVNAADVGNTLGRAIKALRSRSW